MSRRVWRGPAGALVAHDAWRDGQRVSLPHVVERVFPTVLGYSEDGHDNTNDWVFPAELPSGIQAGDLLVGMWTGYESQAYDLLLPSGWQSLVYEQVSGGERVARVIYRWADGTEGSSVDLESSGNIARQCATFLRIGDADDIEAGGVDDGTSGNPRAASFSPSWGSENSLWLTSVFTASTDSITPPTDYGDVVTAATRDNTATEWHGRTATARREQAVASDHPTSWVMSTTDFEWVCATVVILGVE